jgi:hypothetical protein
MAELDTENDLIIATTASRVLVRIKPDGSLVYGPDYTPDEAADVFWRALARRRAEAEVKELRFRHIEKLLIEAGEADLANQVAQDRENKMAADASVSKAERLQAHLDSAAANGALNEAAYRLVEIGRRLALRGAEDPVSEGPVKDPSSLN